MDCLCQDYFHKAVRTSNSTSLDGLFLFLYSYSLQLSGDMQSVARPSSSWASPTHCQAVRGSTPAAWAAVIAQRWDRLASQDERAGARGSSGGAILESFGASSGLHGSAERKIKKREEMV